MKAILLLATLKEKGPSNTAVLSEFAVGYLEKQGIECEIIRLAGHTIVPGTYIKMDTPDDFPALYEKILGSDIVLFATPIWWNSHSSLLQRVIERLDEVFDIINQGKPSPLEGKLGGMIITGDSDGVEHLTGNIANFFCSLGITVPAYASLGVIYEGHAKGKRTAKATLLKHYKKEYAKDAESMAKSFAKFASAEK
jgi:multimeric flavodoxin WrbA